MSMGALVRSYIDKARTNDVMVGIDWGAGDESRTVLATVDRQGNLIEVREFK